MYIDYLVNNQIFTVCALACDHPLYGKGFDLYSQTSVGGISALVATRSLLPIRTSLIEMFHLTMYLVGIFLLFYVQYNISTSHFFDHANNYFGEVL